jgi:hypothetical protein
MRYDTLPLIADLYIPALLLSIAVILCKRPHKAKALMALGISMIGVYGIRVLDQFTSLWPRAGWDYSTHTAFAAVCVWFLWRNLRHVIWPWSLAGYFALMIHLRYHTLADILSTLAVMALWISLQEKMLPRHRAVKNDSLNSSQSPAYERDRNLDHRR